MNNFRKLLIGDRHFYKMILLIAVPVMIQNGITNFVSLLDNIMVGRVGTGCVSAAGIFGWQRLQR
jgi:Na+-driven multidrug efflux pump